MSIKCALLLCSVISITDAVFHACQDVYYDNPHSQSGTYRVYNKRNEVYDVWCEFHQNYGYAFVSNLSHVEINIEDLYTDRTHVLMRHITSSDVQKEIKLEQLSNYHTQPLSFFYNKHDGFSTPQNHEKLGPYLYLGFLPVSIASSRNIQGYRAGGNDLSFINCDSNPNSYIALFFNSKNNDPVGYFHTCCASPLITYWTEHSVALQKDKYMDPHYYFMFEMHMGGCGGYEISLHQDLVNINGAAMGFRFDITDPCSGSPCQNGGSCFAEGRSYTCECVTGYIGRFCEQIMI